LKYIYTQQLLPLLSVAPCVGAWIEIHQPKKVPGGSVVAPCVGAWIEIATNAAVLKDGSVAPCVGAWIEI